MTFGLVLIFSICSILAWKLIKELLGVSDRSTPPGPGQAQIQIEINMALVEDASTILQNMKVRKKDADKAAMMAVMQITAQNQVQGRSPPTIEKDMTRLMQYLYRYCSTADLKDEY